MNGNPALSAQPALTLSLSKGRNPSKGRLSASPTPKTRFVLSLSKDRFSFFRAAFVSLLALTLTACLPRPHIAPPPPGAPPFPVAAFFTGASHGEGRLQILTRSPSAVHVRSQGQMLADGTLVIDQSIVEHPAAGPKPPTTRQWRIREVTPGEWQGTLTDAPTARHPQPFVMPVTAEAPATSPATLHIRFPMRGGMQAEQWLTLAPDGQSADNVMTVSKWGLTVAVLHEQISRD